MRPLAQKARETLLDFFGKFMPKIKPYISKKKVNCKKITG